MNLTRRTNRGFLLAVCATGLALAGCASSSMSSSGSTGSPSSSSGSPSSSSGSSSGSMGSPSSSTGSSSDSRGSSSGSQNSSSGSQGSTGAREGGSVGDAGQGQDGTGEQSAGMPGGMPGGLPGDMAGGMPGGDQASGGASGSESEGDVGAEGSSTTGEGGAYGTVGSVGERNGAGGMPDMAGESGGGAGSLEDEFERSLGDFDDSLLEEQQKVSQVSRDTGAFETPEGGGTGGVVGLGEQAGERGGGTVGVVNSAGGSVGSSMNQEASSVDQLTKEQIGERTPDDIPTGVDDDVVAKQLREAALAEEDPELRERLWDEYRTYKGL